MSFTPYSTHFYDNGSSSENAKTYKCGNVDYSGGFGVKRHNNDSDDEVNRSLKKRLIEGLSGLSLQESVFQSSPEGSPGLNNGNSVTTETVDADYMDTSSKDVIFIPSIDQFLQENPDTEIDYKKTKPFDLQDKMHQNVVIPASFLKPINEIFTDESKNKNEKYLIERKKFSFEKLLSRKKRERKLREKKKNIDTDTEDTSATDDDDDDYDDDLMSDDDDNRKLKLYKHLKQNKTSDEISISNEELYYEVYVQEYWSLIKYYNPKLLVWLIFRKWLQNNNKRNAMYYNSNVSEVDLRTNKIEEIKNDIEDEPHYSYYSDEMNKHVYDNYNYGDDTIGSNYNYNESPRFINTFQHSFQTSTPSPTSKRRINNTYGNYYGDTTDDKGYNSDSFSMFDDEDINEIIPAVTGSNANETPMDSNGEIEVGDETICKNDSSFQESFSNTKTNNNNDNDNDGPIIDNDGDLDMG
ncbi:hypothetical protein PACTADRAFT_48578 [Pachysolen tannophilus NRRL Y-2460]|uniref:Uncharacterized protein n=1 Tax=Pachysolen tannophilus NRRL Y-2460 TaxID=669874 RepID=A0A1E4TYF7_PACTA|nr:hypothetical protein PACTADRAFT_48578 [Pachysolen tannophilus NRRL Y-2460]